MCPYARFQAAMFDRNTLIISYDPGARRTARLALSAARSRSAQGLGDCIDCTLCVQVCPTGIDIRNGLQVGCIACAACVDVCDSVMDKMGYPKGLIRYTSENALEGKPVKLLRPRVLIYGGILTAIAAALLIAVLLRVPLKVDVLRDRNALFRETFDGLIENSYTLKIMNMDNETHRYRVSAHGIEGLQLRTDRPEITVAAGEVAELPVSLQADPASMTQRSVRRCISACRRSIPMTWPPNRARASWGRRRDVEVPKLARNYFPLPLREGVRGRGIHSM
jgi:cytochrome c oxidase accessory protein FixG